MKKHKTKFEALFTGLRDIGGREIYEGDIIRESHYADSDVYDVHDAVVRFDRGAFVLDFCELNNGRLGIYVMRERRPDNYRQWRVVGNIYDPNGVEWRKEL